MKLLLVAIFRNFIALSVTVHAIALAGCGTKSPGDENAHLSTNLIKSQNSDNEDLISNELPVMSFTLEEFDFGVIHEGDVVEYAFEFKNTGNAPLIISKTSVTCGCTVADYPKQPINPGETGKISVKFDSSGKHSGPQKRNIYITANTEPNQNVISLVGEII